MSICEGIVQILEEQAAARHFSRVNTVWLEIGQLAGIELDALRFGFDAVTRGTVAEGATLEVLEVPGTAWCMDCEQVVALVQRYDACPRCQGYHVLVNGGEELRIKELEVI